MTYFKFKSWITHVANYLITALILSNISLKHVFGLSLELLFAYCRECAHNIVPLSSCDFICYFFMQKLDGHSMLLYFCTVFCPFLHLHAFRICNMRERIFFVRFQQTKMRKTHSHFIFAAIIFILQSKRSGPMLDVRLFYCGKFSVCLKIIHVLTRHPSICLSLRLILSVLLSIL